MIDDDYLARHRQIFAERQRFITGLPDLRGFTFRGAPPVEFDPFAPQLADLVNAKPRQPIRTSEQDRVRRRTMAMIALENSVAELEAERTQAEAAAKQHIFESTAVGRLIRR